MWGIVIRGRVVWGSLEEGKVQGAVDFGVHSVGDQRPFHVEFWATIGAGAERTRTKTQRSGSVGGSGSSSDSSSGSGSAFGISGITRGSVCTSLRGRGGGGRGEGGVMDGLERSGSKEGSQSQRHKDQGRKRGTKDDGKRGVVSRSTLTSNAWAREHRRNGGG